MSTSAPVLLDKGYYSHVYRIPGTQKVVKSFLATEADTQFPVESAVYERFTSRGHPKTILRYYGVEKDDPAGLILEFASIGNLNFYLWDVVRNIEYLRMKSPDLNFEPPSRENFYRWAEQAAEALAFSHSCGVLHCDIHCVNFLLDEQFDLKLADFGGASIDGSIPCCMYRRTHQLPAVNAGGRKPFSIASEIFAFGSAMYNMATGHDIFPELDYEDDKVEIVRRLRDREFPETGDLIALGTIINHCWQLRYDSMDEVLKAIKQDYQQNDEHL